MKFRFVMTKGLKQKTAQLRTRAYSRNVESVDVDSKSFDIIITTETAAVMLIVDPKNPENWIEVEEILLMSGLDNSRESGMPLVDCHDTLAGIQKILGKVEDIRVEGDQVVAKATLNSRNFDLIDDIKNGHYRQISAGYYVNEYEIQYRENDIPLVHATNWTLIEASLVAVGADANARIRSSNQYKSPKISFKNQTKSSLKKRSKTRSNTEKKTMELEELETLIVAAEEAVVAIEEAIEDIAEEIPADLEERMRKLRSDTDEEKEERKRKRSDDTDEDDKENRSKKRSDTDEDDKKEEEEIRSARSIARSYGLTKMVDDLVKLGARSTEVKASIRSAILKNGTSTNAGSRSNIEPKKRSESVTFDTNAIYARRNKTVN